MPGAIAPSSSMPRARAPFAVAMRLWEAPPQTLSQEIRAAQR